ncbi:MAG: hypothetical protein ACR2P4_08620 [Gammaproteobacteria bacterium]
MNRRIKQTSPERATENNGGECHNGRGLWFLPGFALQKNGTPFQGLING